MKASYLNSSEKLSNPIGKIEESLTNLDIFILQNKIGSGSFGKVYKIKEKSTGFLYAAKVSLKSIDELLKDDITNLSREINIISKLNHPSVLKFIGYSPTDFKKRNKPVIITEYAPNGTLEDLIKNERVSTNKDNHIDT